MMDLTKIAGILDPSRYHGWKAQPPFFEGWYYKLVDQNARQILAIIPGVLLHKDAQESHTFIQVLNGSDGQSHYFRFPLEKFHATTKSFNLKIGANQFKEDFLHLDIDEADCRLQGELHFKSLTPWPVTLWSPGIMGWYAWVPFMECYHGIISLDHEIYGSLRLNDRTIDFTGGRGYCEKDWGRCFPTAYLWIQSNHFSSPCSTFIASIAIIPWLRKSKFLGFIVGFRHNGTLYRFATYTGARLETMAIDDCTIQFTVADKRYRLEVKAERGDGGLLQAPDQLGMTTRIAECLQGPVHVRLTRLQRHDIEEIFCGAGDCAGVEAVGDLKLLLSMAS